MPKREHIFWGICYNLAKNIPMQEPLSSFALFLKEIGFMLRRSYLWLEYLIFWMDREFKYSVAKSLPTPNFWSRAFLNFCQLWGIWTSQAYKHFFSLKVQIIGKSLNKGPAQKFGSGKTFWQQYISLWFLANKVMIFPFTWCFILSKARFTNS